MNSTFSEDLMPLHNDPYLRGRFSSDMAFNQLYPVSAQKLANRHWTPLDAVKEAARFLASRQGVRILDIGSGIGKFCLGAAYYAPSAHYFGIEQRHNLLSLAETARQDLGFSNVTFLHGNFTQLNLADYDHFYFYNSFYENLVGTDKIDESIDYSAELYFYYTRFLFKQLEKMPSGTRLATFHSLEGEIPADFMVVGSAFDSLLKFWVKL